MAEIKQTYKHLIVSITEADGGKEYCTTVLLAIRADKSQEEALDRFWVEWRDPNIEDEFEGDYHTVLAVCKNELEEDNGYWSDTAIVQYPVVEKTVKPEDVKVLEKYLDVITVN